jgi:RNA polymerase sigma factor (sigma-70 family)
MKDRTNQEWLDDLRGPGRDDALADLRAFLVRGLGYSLANRSDVDGALVEDMAQEALLKILDSLDTFLGESRFTTWAQKIAVRVAFTELRRHHWRDLSLEAC